MRSPVTSIIIPCYRQAHFLPLAVRSALAQSIQDVEVVVVDDGSPDDPVGRLGDLAQDPRVVIVQQANLGLPMARNNGVLASHGKFLNFLDADDWLEPEFCERLVAVLESDESIGLVYCDLRRVFEDHAEPSVAEREYSVGRSRRVTSGNILPSLLVGGYFTPNAVLLPRRVLDCVGLFDSELGGHADWDLWLRIAAAGYPARYVDEKLVNYRIHAQSMSRDSAHMRETRLQTLRKLLRAYPDVVVESFEELRRAAEDAAAQQDWIRSLVESNAWNAQHARNWQGEAERRETVIAKLQTESEQLAARLRRVPAPLRRWLQRGASGTEARR